MRIRAIFFLLLILVLQGNADADANPEATTAIRSIVRESFTVLSETRGDLNNDGVEDWVGIILINRPSGAFQRLYVLTKGNGFTLAEASQETSYTDCGGSCGSEISELKNGSFYVVQFSRGGGLSASATTQFKFYKNQWRAIGYRTFSVDFGNDTEHATDTNLLTGAYTITATSGNASGDPKPTKNERGIGKPAMQLLRDFDLGQF
jgi:hypothetical protein